MTTSKKKWKPIFTPTQAERLRNIIDKANKQNDKNEMIIRNPKSRQQINLEGEEVNTIIGSLFEEKKQKDKIKSTQSEA